MSEKDLEQESEIAADFIEEFLDSADLDGDLDIEIKTDRVYISVTSDGDSNLSKISDQETVAALQELTRLAVQSKTGNPSRLILDVAGSRDARVQELAELVQKAATRISDGEASYRLKPMSSYDRKLVHDLVVEAGCRSESEGMGKDRHVVVFAAE
jgi:spoIIIJ-associated protein